MWIYLGQGWFFRREPGDLLRVVVVNQEVIEASGEIRILAQGTFDSEAMLRLLEGLSERSRPEVVRFLQWPPEPLPTG